MRRASCPGDEVLQATEVDAQKKLPIGVRKLSTGLRKRSRYMARVNTYYPRSEGDRVGWVSK